MKRKVAILAPTPPITLIGNAGDTLESKITIANTGDLDSTLKYQQYFISSNEISVPPPFFNPSQPAPNAGARAQGIPLRAYPDEGTLTPANGNFLSPRLTSPEIILSKTSATPAPSREIEVKYFCSSNAPTDSTPLDTGNGYKVKGIVNIVYKTGATDDLGEEIQEKVAVPVTVTCEDVRKPKVGSIEFYLDKDKFLINEYPIVKARVSNVGNAPLYVQSNSGTALIQSGETAELFYRGETCTDVRFITFTAIFTTNDTEKVTFNKEFTISCYYFERIQGNSVFVNSDCNPSLCGLYANYDRFGSYLGSVLGARVLNPLFGIINRANRGLPLTTLQDFASKVADFSNFQAYESYTNSIYEAREASAIKCYFNQDGSSAAETNEAVRCARDAYQTSKNNLETFSNSILSRYLSSLNPKYVKNISYTTETVTDVYERIYIRYVFSFDVILTP